MHYKTENNQPKFQNLSSHPPFVEHVLFNVPPSFFFFNFPPNTLLAESSRIQGYVSMIKSRLGVRNAVVRYGRGEEVNRTPQPLS